MAHSTRRQPPRRAGKPSAAKAARAQRAIQQQVDENDRHRKPGARRRPVQAGERRQPERQPPQHLRKPGRQHELEPQPHDTAPYCEGSHKLQDKVALITGGDSGIGRAAAVLFAREGADVVVCHLEESDDAGRVAADVEREGRRCLLVQGDVKDSACCEDAVAQAVEAFGKLDILVNNAGFQSHCERLEDLTDEHLQETLQTNIAGYFHMARAALPHLGEGSAIIDTGSETGLSGSAGLLDYSATKGAIHAFTRSLAKNLLPRGIPVNAVAPGPVWTPLNPADRPAGDVAKFGRDSAMGRAAQPEELAPAYVFLAAPACSSYLSGSVLEVLGGPTA